MSTIPTRRHVGVGHQDQGFFNTRAYANVYLTGSLSLQCTRRDSNPHVHTDTRLSTWLVYQFQHECMSRRGSQANTIHL